jgi:hypothetical protein
LLGSGPSVAYTQTPKKQNTRLLPGVSAAVSHVVPIKTGITAREESQKLANRQMINCKKSIFKK